MKCKTLVGYETGETEYVDYTFDESSIEGYYTTLENIEDNSIQIQFSGYTHQFKRDKELLDFLYKKFNKK